MITPPAALTSDDTPPTPLSEDDLRQQWNQQADEYNQWESLDSCEQLAWAQALAIRADRHAAALKATPEERRPTDGDLYDLAAEFNGDPVPAMRRALELWGNPLRGAPAPGENPATPSAPGDLATDQLMAASLSASLVKECGLHSPGSSAHDLLQRAAAMLVNYGLPARSAIPPAPEPGEVANLHPLWYLVEFLEGHSAFRRQTEPTDELAQILSDSATLLRQQDAELATLKDDGWAKAMTNLVDQIGGDGPSLWEWGASIPTPKKVVEYLRKHIDYLEYLGRVQGALTALKVDPVAESERPWKREGWCNEKGDFWAEGINTEGIAEWKQANRNCLGSWMVRCLPHNAIPAPQAGDVEA